MGAERPQMAQNYKHRQGWGMGSSGAGDWKGSV